MSKHGLIKKINKFLETRNESYRGGWAKVSDQDMNDLWNIIDNLLSLKFSEDADGDLPINIHINNRNINEKMHFRPVPYDHNNFEEAFRIALSNLRIATERVGHFQDLKRLYQEK